MASCVGKWGRGTRPKYTRSDPSMFIAGYIAHLLGPPADHARAGRVLGALGPNVMSPFGRFLLAIVVPF